METETSREETRELQGRLTIVIGIDGTAKTPLIDGLEALDSRVTRVQTLIDPHVTTHIEKMAIAQQHVGTWKERLSVGQLVVYDRFPYPDDFIYGPITYPTQVQSAQPEAQAWELVMMNYGARFIYIDPLFGSGEVLDRLFKRWIQHVSQDVVQDENHFPVHLPRIHKPLLTRYEQFLKSTSCPVLRIPALPWFGLEQFQVILRWCLAHENELLEERWNTYGVVNGWAIRASRQLSADANIAGAEVAGELSPTDSSDSSS